MAVRTYIDSGVLISVVRGDAKVAASALSFLYDPLREYVTSDYVKVEVLPKAIFHNESDELQSYEDFFKSCQISVPSSDDLLAFAIEHGSQTGISGMDAIHVACAVVAQAQEFITSEKPTKPIHRANGIRIISINP